MAETQALSVDVRAGTCAARLCLPLRLPAATCLCPCPCPRPCPCGCGCGCGVDRRCRGRALCVQTALSVAVAPVFLLALCGVLPAEASVASFLFGVASLRLYARMYLPLVTLLLSTFQGIYLLVNILGKQESGARCIHMVALVRGHVKYLAREENVGAKDEFWGEGARFQRC